MRIAGRLRELAGGGRIDSPEWNKLAAQSEVRAAFTAAAFTALRTASYGEQA
jgi:hypothetical protein